MLVGTVETAGENEAIEKAPRGQSNTGKLCCTVPIMATGTAHNCGCPAGRRLRTAVGWRASIWRPKNGYPGDCW